MKLAIPMNNQYIPAFSFFFFVPCHFRKWMIMALHIFLFFIALSKISRFVIIPSHCSVNRLQKLTDSLLSTVSLDLHCECQILQALLFHYFNSRFPVLNISFLFYFIFLKISLSFICSLCVIPKIRL